MQKHAKRWVTLEILKGLTIKKQKAKEILLKTAQAFSHMVDMMKLVRNCVKEMDLM